jgi:hypothetical protein
MKIINMKTDFAELTHMIGQLIIVEGILIMGNIWYLAMTHEENIHSKNTIFLQKTSTIDMVRRQASNLNPTVLSQLTWEPNLPQLEADLPTRYSPALVKGKLTESSQSPFLLMMTDMEIEMIILNPKPFEFRYFSRDGLKLSEFEVASHSAIPLSEAIQQENLELAIQGILFGTHDNQLFLTSDWQSINQPTQWIPVQFSDNEGLKSFHYSQLTNAGLTYKYGYEVQVWATIQRIASNNSIKITNIKKIAIQRGITQIHVYDFNVK